MGINNILIFICFGHDIYGQVKKVANKITVLEDSFLCRFTTFYLLIWNDGCLVRITFHKVTRHLWILDLRTESLWRAQALHKNWRRYGWGCRIPMGRRSRMDVSFSGFFGDKIVSSSLSKSMTYGTWHSTGSTDSSLVEPSSSADSDDPLESLSSSKGFVLFRGPMESSTFSNGCIWRTGESWSWIMVSVNSMGCVSAASLAAGMAASTDVQRAKQTRNPSN